MVKSKWLKNMDKKKNSLFLITVHCTINLNFFMLVFVMHWYVGRFHYAKLLMCKDDLCLF